MERAKKDCILDSAAKAFARLGFKKASIDAIARAARVAKGTVYLACESKEDLFFQAVHRDRYDAIVVMYHDQGHAPMKLMAFDTGVNVTLGLPIIRTSVDHGTAFDIAWTGQAFTGSLDHALAYANRLVGR